MNPTSHVSLVSKAREREIKVFLSPALRAMSLPLCSACGTEWCQRQRQPPACLSLPWWLHVGESRDTGLSYTHTDIHPERYEEVGAPIQALNWHKMGVPFLPRVSLQFTGDPLRARVTVLCEQKGRWIILWISLHPEYLMSRDYYCTCPIWGPLPCTAALSSSLSTRPLFKTFLSKGDHSKKSLFLPVGNGYDIWWLPEKETSFSKEEQVAVADWNTMLAFIIS